MPFPENLQFLRNRANSTQEQLAEQLDVSRQSVSKWESGASFPEMDTLLRICDLYNTNLDTLLRGNVELDQIADTAQYDKAMNRLTHCITFSVGAIIAAVSIMILLIAFGVSEILSTAFLLFVITVSVVVMVASCIQHDGFQKKYPFINDFYKQEEKDAFHQKFVWLIAGGIGAILFGVVLLILFFYFFPEKEPYESIAAGIFLLIISAAVMTLIYAVMQNGKYNVSEYNRDNNPVPEVKKRKNVNETICACIMLTATAVYLIFGFTKNLWGSVWWVFPVGGILCGIVSVILNPDD